MKYPQHIITDFSPSTRTSRDYSAQWGCWASEFKRLNLRSDNFKATPLRWTNLLQTVSNPVSSQNSTSSNSFSNPGYFSIIDANFLRKEKLYTKLKYSRCPQYDIVSGGFAAILAGFVGFLISEKFGIELVDSGDFYVAFMYGVFLAIMTRPLVYIYSKEDTAYHPLSPKYLFIFYSNLVTLTLRLIKKFILRT